MKNLFLAVLLVAFVSFGAYVRANCSCKPPDKQCEVSGVVTCCGCGKEASACIACKPEQTCTAGQDYINKDWGVANCGD